MTSWQMEKTSSRKPGKMQLGEMQTLAIAAVELGSNCIEM